MMDLVKTTELMKSKDHKNRLKAEYLQLKIRLEKLTTLIKTAQEGTTLKFELNCPLELLEEQKNVMSNYLKILKRRATLEGINLKDLCTFEDLQVGDVFAYQDLLWTKLGDYYNDIYNGICLSKELEDPKKFFSRDDIVEKVNVSFSIEEPIKLTLDEEKLSRELFSKGYRYIFREKTNNHIVFNKYEPDLCGLALEYTEEGSFSFIKTTDEPRKIEDLINY